LLKITELFGTNESLAIEVLKAAERRLFVDAHPFGQSARAGVDVAVVVAIFERQHVEQRLEGVSVQALKQR
jgi:hypothetical protein